MTQAVYRVNSAQLGFVNQVGTLPLKHTEAILSEGSGLSRCKDLELALLVEFMGAWL